MKRSRSSVLAVLAATGLLAGCAAGQPERDEVRVGVEANVSPKTVTVTRIDGNPTCADLGSFYSFRIDASELAIGQEKAFTTPEGVKILVTTMDGVTFSWRSGEAMDYVLAKGGDAANAYHYTPESWSGSPLAPPVNASGGPAAISHIDFCWDYELKMLKTADAAYKRRYDWTISKTGADTNLTLATGQTFLESYSVKVEPTATDSDFSASGTIIVKNPDPNNTAHVLGVTDEMCGTFPAVDCGVTFPYDLAPLEKLTCTYSGALPSKTDCKNIAKGQTAGAVGDGIAVAMVKFGEPTSVVDKCVSVEDSLVGNLGTACESKTFTYSYPIRYDACGDYDLPNTATFTTSDRAQTGSSTWTVRSHLACASGCTLTQGYWKTHSSYGPAPYDDAWTNLGAAGADTPFFLSGQSYYQVLRTAPAGNQYYVLAHQYAAAHLNQLNGATFDAATQAAFAEATAILSSVTPAQVSSMRRSSLTYLRLVSLAMSLDDFNNGLVGPGHCSE